MNREPLQGFTACPNDLVVSGSWGCRASIGSSLSTCVREGVRDLMNPSDIGIPAKNIFARAKNALANAFAIPAFAAVPV